MTDLPQPSRLPDPKDRRETEAWLDRRSEKLGDAIARSLKKVVTSAYEKFLATLPETSIVSSLTAAGDLHSFDSIIGQWRLIYDKEIAPEIEETYLSGAMSAFTQAPGTAALSDAEVGSWARVTNDQAVRYMTDASNRLAGVGDTIWSDVRERVTNAVASGMSNEELKDQIGKLSDFSEYRADTIARTETISAYVNGDWEGAQLLGEFGPVEKVWVATGDARGREWHTALMDQSLPMDEPFDVDGEPMLYPHDPSGSAFNVVNCRCYIEFLYVGDTRPDGSVIGESELPTVEDTMLDVYGAPEEIAVSTGEFTDEFTPGMWTEITEDNRDAFVEFFIGDKYAAYPNIQATQRKSVSQMVTDAHRIVSNGNVVIVDSAGVAAESFELLVREVDQLRTLQPQLADRLIVEASTKLGVNVNGDCEMVSDITQTARLRIKAGNLDRDKMLDMTGFKQASAPIESRVWTIVHEWGHAIDDGNLTGAPRNTFFGKIRKTYPGKPPDGLSGYGRTDKWEGYAESFADWWTSRGTTTNPATRAYAERYGWRHP